MISIIAYVGPGPGLSMGWALFALLATVFSAIFAVFLWPLRVALRKMRGGGDEDAEASDEEEAEAGSEEDAPEAESPPAA